MLPVTYREGKGRGREGKGEGREGRGGRYSGKTKDMYMNIMLTPYVMVTYLSKYGMFVVQFICSV